MDTKKAYLILADGTVFEGQSIGVTGTTIGETVFTTGMTSKHSQIQVTLARL